MTETSLSIRESFRHAPVTITAQPLGSDLCVIVAGGDQPHVGAVALSLPRPAPSPAGSCSATSSVLTVPGHMDDELARRVGKRLATRLNTLTSVVCGIHYDALHSSELQRLLDLVDTMVDRLITALMDRDLPQPKD